MTWGEQARRDAQAEVDRLIGKRSKPAKVRKTKRLGLPDSEAIRIPAASGKRVLVTPSWQGSSRSASPCVSYTLDDPTPRLFTPATKGERATRRAQPTTVAKVPEVWARRDTIGTHDLTND